MLFLIIALGIAIYAYRSAINNRSLFIGMSFFGRFDRIGKPKCYWGSIFWNAFAVSCWVGIGVYYLINNDLPK